MINKTTEKNMFLSEMEDIAIQRIRKFYSIAQKFGFEVHLAFSGGKDSQVCYDLCKRSGIPFKAYFNHCFESRVTLNFIREKYPDVIYRRVVKEGFIRNIKVNHNGFLPTAYHAYCCEDFKHNKKNIDECSIVGVRRSESSTRRYRNVFETKNKTLLKRNKAMFNEYFEEHCQSSGTSSIIQLKPIIDWDDEDVWDYIQLHGLPINPEYKHHRRVGCIVCCKVGFQSNIITLMRMPKIVDAFINARSNERSWIIDGKDFSDDKPYYICRWLNHSWRPFTNREQQLYEQWRKIYDNMHKSD